MEWNDGFKLGIVSIDAQHKELFNLLLQLQTAIKKGEEQKAYANTIRALVEYTKHHFCEEESYMATIKYPKLSEHKMIHEKLISDIKDILIHLKQGQPIQAISLMRFLNDWVCKHILDEDLQISKFVLSEQRNKIPLSLSPKPLGNEGEELLATFQSLLKQREQNALTEMAYYTNCNDILKTKFELVDFSKSGGLFKALAFIEFLLKNSVITEKDKLTFNTVLISRSISANILSEFPDPESRYRFLKNLQNDKFISDKDFEILKSMIK